MSMLGIAHCNTLSRARTSRAFARLSALPTSRRPLYTRQPPALTPFTSTRILGAPRMAHASPAFCHSHPTRARLLGPRRALSRRACMPRPARSWLSAAATLTTVSAVFTRRRLIAGSLAARQARRDARARSSPRPPRTCRRPTRAPGGRRARSRRRRASGGDAHMPGRRAGPLCLVQKVSCRCQRGPRAYARCEGAYGSGLAPHSAAARPLQFSLYTYARCTLLHPYTSPYRAPPHGGGGQLRLYYSLHRRLPPPLCQSHPRTLHFTPR